MARLIRPGSEGPARYVTVPEFNALSTPTEGAGVTYDPNAQGIYEGSRVFRRGGAGTLQIEAQVNIAYVTGYVILIVPDGYKPTRRQWASVRSIAGATYLLVLNPNGYLSTQDAIPSGTQLLGAVSGYPLP